MGWFGQGRRAGVAAAADGSVYVTGGTRSFGAGDEDAFLLKYAANGAAPGTIYATGATSAFGAGEADVFLLSFTPTGTRNWQRTWGGDFFDVPRGIAVATDGNIYLTGDTGNSAFLVKFSSEGTVGVQREWGVVGKTGIPNDDQTFAFDIAAAPDGGAFVVGDTSGTGFNPKLVAARFDSGGNFVWLRVGGPGFGPRRA